MSALQSISVTGSPAKSKAKAKEAAAARPPRIAAAPEDQARVKRKLEKSAEDAIDIVQAMIDNARQRASEIEDVPRLTKDDIAIIEHTANNAIRVFNLGQAHKTPALLDEPPASPKGFAGLKVFGGKVFSGKGKPVEGSIVAPTEVSGGGSSE